MKFELKTVDIGADEFVVGLTGDIDLYTAPELKSELNRLIDAGARRVVVDLTAATFIDSTTLGVLLGALKRFRPSGGRAGARCSASHIRLLVWISLRVRLLPAF